MSGLMARAWPARPGIATESSGDNVPTTAFLFHHIGIAVKDIAAAIGAYRRTLGYEIVSGPIDDLVQDVTVCFLSRGVADPMLELVAPLGSESPVARIVKQGGGLYHICYEVADMDRAISELTANEALPLSGPVPAAAFGERRIAWLMMDTGLLVELLQA